MVGKGVVLLAMNVVTGYYWVAWGVCGLLGSLGFMQIVENALQMQFLMVNGMFKKPIVATKGVGLILLIFAGGGLLIEFIST